MDSPKKQIQPRIAADVYERLTHACQQQQCTIGDVVEAALRQYLWPEREETKLDALTMQLSSFSQNVELELGTIQQILSHMAGMNTSLPEKPPLELEAPIKIATYAEMYGDELKPTPTPPPPPLRPVVKHRRRWRLWPAIRWRVRWW